MVAAIHSPPLGNRLPSISDTIARGLRIRHVLTLRPYFHRNVNAVVSTDSFFALIDERADDSVTPYHMPQVSGVAIPWRCRVDHGTALAR